MGSGEAGVGGKRGWVGGEEAGGRRGEGGDRSEVTPVLLFSVCS